MRRVQPLFKPQESTGEFFHFRFLIGIHGVFFTALINALANTREFGG